MKPGRLIRVGTMSTLLLASLLLLGSRQKRSPLVREVSAAEPAQQAAISVQAEFFVAPTGDDSNPGTQERPIATLDHAREVIAREVAAGLRTNITAFLRSGTYYLGRPLVFGPKHSGTDRFSITFAAYQGDKPIISGGRRIGGWKPGAGGLWTAEIPDVKAGKWYFRQLFVNGKRAVRARAPNMDAPVPYFKLQGSQMAENNGIIGSMNITLSPQELGSWQRPHDIEVTILGEWAPYRKRLQAIDAKNGIVWLASPHGSVNPLNMPRQESRCYFENALELLDQPNEWYLDRKTGTLYYWPESGVDLNSIEIVAPVLTSLMEIRGTPKLHVKNLHFKGLTFTCCDWPLPPVGFLGRQAADYFTKGKNIDGNSRLVDAALSWRDAEFCSFEDGQISGAGGSGLWLEAGCAHNLIQGNVIYDVGADGVMVGTQNNPVVLQEAVRANRIANNILYTCGVDYQSGVGIWVGLSAGSVVSHNELYDLPYTGISLGWKWDTTPTICQDNLVEYNNVHHFMKTLSDGAGIYTLGFQPGTIIRGNLVHDNAYHGQGTYGANSLQLDDGSKGFYIENNITCDGAGRVHINGAPGLASTPSEWYTWGTNYFEVNSSDVNFPRELAGRAGLEPEYRKQLLKDGASTKAQ